MKNAQAWTNLYTYLIIGFLFTLGVIAIQIVGNESASNSNSALDNDSIEYILNLNDLNMSDYQATVDEIEDPILAVGNRSQGNPKDEALDFLLAKEKGSTLELAAKSIFSVPKVVLVDIFRFPLSNWQWVITLLNNLWRLLLIAATIYFVRGVIDR